LRHGDLRRETFAGTLLVLKLTNTLETRSALLDHGVVPQGTAALKIRCLRSCPCDFVNNKLAIAIKLVTIHFHGFWVPRGGMTTL
jgi:hypothetical protein